MTTMPTHNDPITPLALHACAECKRNMGHYHYTDGTVVELCPGCDAPHADELAAVVSTRDAAAVVDVADWLGRALANVHDVSFDLVFAAFQASAAITYARRRVYDIDNPAVARRGEGIVEQVRLYALEAIGTRLEEHTAAAVAHAAEADRAARKAARKSRRRKADSLPPLPMTEAEVAYWRNRDPITGRDRY